MKVRRSHIEHPAYAEHNAGDAECANSRHAICVETRRNLAHEHAYPEQGFHHADLRYGDAELLQSRDTRGGAPGEPEVEAHNEGEVDVPSVEKGFFHGSSRK